MELRGRPEHRAQKAKDKRREAKHRARPVDDEQRIAANSEADTDDEGVHEGTRQHKRIRQLTCKTVSEIHDNTGTYERRFRQLTV